MSRFYYRSFVIISFCFACLLLPSCSQPQRNEAQKPFVHENTYGIGKPSPDQLRDYHPNYSVIHGENIEYSTSKTPREVLGFYTEKEGAYPGSQHTVNLQSANLSIIAPFWYKLDDKHPGSLICSVTADHKRKVIQNTHEKHVKVYLVVHNLFYETVEKGKQAARNVIDNDTNRNAFMQSLRKEIKQFGYDGINIDIENLYLTDRNAFSQMVKKLSDTLHREGKAVTVSVPANTGDSRANPWSQWFDYSQIGLFADRVIMMTYDEHNPRTKPGSTASIDWTEATIRYALKQGVPPSKILLGIAGYGWDWDTTANKAFYSSYAVLMGQKTKYKAKIKWDPRTQTPYFGYADENNHTHQAWFENSYSLRFKLNLVEKYNLQGIGIWRLGLEDPMYWTAIPGKIRITK